MRKLILSTILYFVSTVACFAGPPPAPSSLPPNFTIAFYYGYNPPVDLLHAFNIAVVDPGSQFDAKNYHTAHSQAYAYVSIGEVDPGKTYASQIKPTWVLGRNPAWDSQVMDLSNPAWQQFLVNQVITPLWDKGYRGFFFDTMDSYQLVAKTPQAQAAQVAGLIAVIQQVKAKYPDAQIILNRGFELLPQVHQLVLGIAAESLFQGWNASTQTYTQVTPEARAWLTTKLQEAKTLGVTPIVIDYLPPRQRQETRATAQKIAALGFVPWVTNSALNEMGVGRIEAVPREILMIHQNKNIFEAPVLSFATFPLNYLGYTTDYQDINTPLPVDTLTGRYAGIIVWPNENSNKQTDVFYKFIMKQIQDGIPIAFFDYFGFPMTNAYLNPLGLQTGIDKAGVSTVKVNIKSSMFGFEIPPLPDSLNHTPLHLNRGQVLIQAESSQGENGDMAGITPWGGYIMFPYALRELPNRNSRWVVNPFDFLKTALRLQSLPAPDTTTENGRRLMMVHVDGDAFISRAEWDPTLIAGQAMLQEIFQRYRVPTDVSVIIGEIAPFGVAPELSALATQTARDIFALPWVEITSHTYSHPFIWQHFTDNTPASGDAYNHNGKKNAKQYHLPIPNYQLSIKTEITGSIDYINQYLAPPGKRCKVLQWSGDSQVSEQALALTYQDHVANINGGNTTISLEMSSLTNIGPLGLEQGPYFQLFSPNQNDNVYTNLWRGPFYGYSQVIQTFELTENPYRLKPIDIYYHMYSATKTASLSALKAVYDWALKQPVFNLYISDYFNIALDFNHLALAREGDAWLIYNSGALRELRVPLSMGIPDLTRSENIVGYNIHDHNYYIHMGPATTTVLYFIQPPVESSLKSLVDYTLQLVCSPSLRHFDLSLSRLCKQLPHSTPYLEEANAWVTQFVKTPQGFNFSLQGYLPLRFTLANMRSCLLYQNQRLLTGDYLSPGVDAFSLPTTESLNLQVVCS